MLCKPLLQPSSHKSWIPFSSPKTSLVWRYDIHSSKGTSEKGWRRGRNIYSSPTTNPLIHPPTRQFTQGEYGWKNDGGKGKISPPNIKPFIHIYPHNKWFANPFSLSQFLWSRFSSPQNFSCLDIQYTWIQVEYRVSAGGGGRDKFIHSQLPSLWYTPPPQEITGGVWYNNKGDISFAKEMFYSLNI